MKVRFSLGAAIFCLLAMPACDDSTKTYPVKFVCESTGGTTCPAGSECPALPLGADTCGDLPGLFDHPSTPVTKGRPIGCTVWLSYGNPYYGDSQQVCTCTILNPSASSSTPKWSCPI